MSVHYAPRSVVQCCETKNEAHELSDWFSDAACEFGLTVSLKNAAARHVRKMRKFLSKYADHVIAKYVAKICGNRP